MEQSQISKRRKKGIVKSNDFPLYSSDIVVLKSFLVRTLIYKDTLTFPPPQHSCLCELTSNGVI